MSPLAFLNSLFQVGRNRRFEDVACPEKTTFSIHAVLLHMMQPGDADVVGEKIREVLAKT